MSSPPANLIKHIKAIYDEYESDLFIDRTFPNILNKFSFQEFFFDRYRYDCQEYTVIRPIYFKDNGINQRHYDFYKIYKKNKSLSDKSHPTSHMINELINRLYDSYEYADDNDYNCLECDELFLAFSFGKNYHTCFKRKHPIVFIMKSK